MKHNRVMLTAGCIKGIIHSYSISVESKIYSAYVCLTSLIIIARFH